MKIRPLNGNVLLKWFPVTEEVKGGIYLGKTADTNSPRKATVVALGAGARDNQGNLVPFDVQINDTVLVMRFGPVDIEIGDEKFALGGEEHILAVLAE
jgi:chaperonin GroES